MPPGCAVHTLATPAQDASASLVGSRRAVGAEAVSPPLQPAVRPPRRAAADCGEGVQGGGAPLPENAIVIDEAITSGLMLGALTAGAPRHDLLTLTGGAIGQGLPNRRGCGHCLPSGR